MAQHVALEHHDTYKSLRAAISSRQDAGTVLLFEDVAPDANAHLAKAVIDLHRRHPGLSFGYFARHPKPDKKDLVRLFVRFLEHPECPPPKHVLALARDLHFSQGELDRIVDHAIETYRLEAGEAHLLLFLARDIPRADIAEVLDIGMDRLKQRVRHLLAKTDGAPNVPALVERLRAEVK
jgi:hypothetical protein